MNNIKYKRYYLKILNNLKTESIFYKNSNIEFSYNDAFEFSIKLINFLKKRKLKKEQYALILIKVLKCMLLFSQY